MEIFPLNHYWRQVRLRRDGAPKVGSAWGVVVPAWLVMSIAVLSVPVAVRAQQTDSQKPVVVQPGAPGAPSKTIPSSTRAVLPPRSKADVEFMQGMIHHHAQAVEMTAMIASHTPNKDLRSLGARISSSQADEIKFMKRHGHALHAGIVHARHGYARHHAVNAWNADAAANGSAATGEGR